MAVAFSSVPARYLMCFIDDRRNGKVTPVLRGLSRGDARKINLPVALNLR
jgi:hypothetical protein